MALTSASWRKPLQDWIIAATLNANKDKMQTQTNKATSSLNQIPPRNRGVSGHDAAKSCFAIARPNGAAITKALKGRSNNVNHWWLFDGKMLMWPNVES